MPKKSPRPMDEAQRRAYERDRKRRYRAGLRRWARRPLPGPLAQSFEADLDPSGLVRLQTRVPLGLRMRLDNASYATGTTLQAIVERALAAEVDRLEAQGNGHLPFPEPPDGLGARERSRRASHARHNARQSASQARQKPPPTTTWEPPEPEEATSSQSL